MQIKLKCIQISQICKSPAVHCRASPRHLWWAVNSPTLGNNDGSCHSAELLCVKSFLLMGALLFLCLALGSEPSTAPHEWPGKVLTYLAGASGAQPGCYGLPESLSIHLNARMRSWVPVICSTLACVWNYVCSQIVCERVWLAGEGVAALLAGSFWPFFFFTWPAK